MDDPQLGTDETRPVTLPSGALFHVYPQEVGYFQERVKRYLSDNKFTNVSDHQDLDRLFILEILAYRYGVWALQQRDYFGEPVDDKALAKQLKELSAEIRQVKDQLGIDKTSRDKQRGEDSVAVYLENLRRRAKEFGVNREKMLDKSLELSQELIARLTLLDQSDEVERREQKITEKLLIEWVRTEYVPRFNEVDAHFRANQQRLWIRDQ